MRASSRNTIARQTVLSSSKTIGSKLKKEEPEMSKGRTKIYRGKVKTLNTSNSIIPFENKPVHTTSQKKVTRKKEEPKPVIVNDAFNQEHSSPVLDFSETVEDNVPNVIKEATPMSETIETVKKVAIGTGVSLALRYLIKKIF